MSIYAIGDLQGCYKEFRKLLDKIKFDPNTDTLWLTGDLVNRGPKSLKTLRYVKGLGDAVVTVLGNHDLHLIAAHGLPKHYPASKDLQSIIDASDADELIAWLRQQPLMHYDKKMKTALVHAGIAPQWSIKDALRYAHEFETILKRDDYHLFLPAMYGDLPNKWSKRLEGSERLNFIVNAFTRMRFCNKNGRLTFTEKNNPAKAPDDLLPWFDVPKRKTNDVRIVFGHWSTLGYVNKEHVLAIDTGCVWGGELTAVKISGKKVEQTCISCESAS